MSYNITIKQNGFVTGDFLEPIAYAGEMNSRKLNIVHPLYDDCFYQLIVVKEKRPYTLGIVDGETMLPPSLTDIAGKLDCQFIAVRKNDSIDISTNACDCYPSSTNDCAHMIFKSDKFTLQVAEGLSLNGLTPIPPYEQLVDMYNNIGKAKLAVEKIKAENQALLDEINNKLDKLNIEGYKLNTEISERKAADLELENKIKELSNNE